MIGRNGISRAAILLMGFIMTLGRPLGGQDLPVPADRWNRAAMEWVTLLDSGQFSQASAGVDPEVPAHAFSPEQLQTIWGQLSAQLGPLRTLEAGPVTEHESYHIVDLAAAFQAQSVVLRVVLTDALEVSGFFIRPPEPPAYQAPEYVDEDAFAETEVNVGEEPWTLPGVLAVPEGEGPFPAVVLVHGSGPNDRDETVGGNRPFRDLAWGLASKGIAVLRYDKRTRVYSGALPAELGLEEEVVEDALLALKLVRGRQEVNPDSVFLLGHSLGAMLAPDIALKDGLVAGVAMLASPARPFLEVLKEQLAYVASLEEPGSASRTQLDSVLAEVDEAMAGKLDPGAPILGVRRGYWEELEQVDPVGSAGTLPLPILVLQGGRDYQSTPEDFRIWEEALGGRDGVTLELYPGLNHLFAPGEGKATPWEYTTQVKHVDPQVIRDLARWILTGGLSHP